MSGKFLVSVSRPTLNDLLCPGYQDATPSKTGSIHRVDSSILVPLSARSANFAHSKDQGPSDFQADQQSLSTDESTIEQAQQSRAISLAGRSILTEASFAITQDRLVQVITQVYPFESNWEDLEKINLTGFGIESVTKMKDLLPSVTTVNL